MPEGIPQQKGSVMVYHLSGNLFTSPARVRCHQVNCRGVMGSGIAREARQRYPDMFAEYQMRCAANGRANLGSVQFYEAPDGTILANLFGQDNFGTGKQTDEQALYRAMETVKAFAVERHCSVGFPEKIGCDRGGGDWAVVSAYIESLFGASDDPDCYLVSFQPKPQTR